jgi:hypothetical protein
MNAIFEVTNGRNGARLPLELQRLKRERIYSSILVPNTVVLSQY